VVEVKKYFLCVLATLIVSSYSFGQSNDVIDAFLEEEYADYERTVYLLMTASGKLAEDLSPAVAVATLDETLGLDSTAKKGTAIPFGDFAFYMMETFDLPGGIFYGFLPGPRYAVRELNYKAFLANSKRETDLLSPFEVLQAISAALEYKEELQ
jgi:hypothetical protein